MPKLWIVHRQARLRQALARLAGLAPDDVLCLAPTEHADASAPAALILGFEGDFEHELDFLHRHRAQLSQARRLFLAPPEEAAAVAQLTDARPEEIQSERPDPRALRRFVLAAVAHRNASPLSARRERDRVDARFARWFGNIEIPGLLRAVDPALVGLPLLVRGVPGAGRSLVARYTELHRVHGPHVETSRGTLRIDGPSLRDLDELGERIEAHRHLTRASDRPALRTLWIDEIDALPPAAQRGLADWMRLGTGLRWVATAGAAGPHQAFKPAFKPAFEPALEPGLAAAFAPLVLEVPAVADDPATLAEFAESIAAEWAEQVGGPIRSFEPDALEALSAFGWSGDRLTIESILRTTFAATSSARVSESDLVASAPIGGVFGGRADSSGSPGGAPSAADLPEAIAFDDPRWEAGHSPTAEAIFDAPVISGEVSGEAAVEVTPQFSAQVPSVTSEDFERAFLEGLPEAPPPTEHDPADPSIASFSSDSPNSPETAASGDLSTDMSNEAFQATSAGFVVAADPATQDWRRLARSLSHEIRNPLVSIRTFTELLPEHYEDPAFRERFQEFVGRDVAHIDEVVSRLADASAEEKLEAAAVDVSEMIERLLENRRDEIGTRRLLVLRELERDAPTAWADAASIEVALAGLLDRALAALPERGDLFVATRHIDRGADGEPRLRILMRHHNPELGATGSLAAETDVSPAANVLEYVLAETIVAASGGQLTIDATDGQESLILVDLRTEPAPRAPADVASV